MRCNEMVGISPLNLNEYFTQAIIPFKASPLSTSWFGHMVLVISVPNI